MCTAVVFNGLRRHHEDPSDAFIARHVAGSAEPKSLHTINPLTLGPSCWRSSHTSGLNCVPDPASVAPCQCPVTSTVTRVRWIQSGGVAQPEPDASAATRITRAMVFIAWFLRPSGVLILITDAPNLGKQVIRRVAGRSGVG